MWDPHPSNSTAVFLRNTWKDQEIRLAGGWASLGNRGVVSSVFASSFLARENVVTTSVPGAQASTLCTKAICNGPRLCSQPPLVPQHGRCSDGLTSRVQSLVLKQDPGCCPVGVHVSKVSDTHSLVNIFVSVPKQHDYSKALDLWEYLGGFSPVFVPANVVSVRECLGIATPWMALVSQKEQVVKFSCHHFLNPALSAIPQCVCHSSPVSTLKKFIWACL